MLEVGAHEDQAAGAALAVGGGDAGLSAPNLFLQVVALASLGILKLFFLRALSSCFGASWRAIAAGAMSRAFPRSLI